MKQAHDKRLILRIDAALIKRLDAAARRFNATRSEIARRAIKFGLEHGAKAQNPKPPKTGELFD